MHYELTTTNIIVPLTHSILVGVLMLITIVVFGSIQLNKFTVVKKCFDRVFCWAFQQVIVNHFD